MKCNICGKKISVVYSRQIYLERKPTENYCIECFEVLLPHYDQLIQNMKNKRCIIKTEVFNDDYDGFGFQDPCHNVDHIEG